MSKILLLEDVHQFIPKPAAVQEIKESMARGQLKFPVEITGRLSVIGIRNENNRRYKKSVWEKQLQENSQLRSLIKARRSVGLLEHPEDGQVSLRSPITHILMDVWMEGDEVFGKLGFINTPEGHKMLALIEAGYNPLVSSRGYGSVVRGSDGVDDVQEDYVCEGWDSVWNPSFKTAELDGSQLRTRSEAKTESTEPAKPALTSESPEVNLYESKTEQSTNNMNDQLKSIRESIAPLATADVASMPPQQVASTLARCGELHRRAAQVADPASSWDVHEIHQEITAVENRLTEAMSAPAKKVAALNEQSTKTLKTLKIVAETALKFKGAATKYLKEAQSKSAKLKETIERGQGWVKRARIAEARLKKVEAKYQFACESVDEIKARYEADTTELGRRMLQLEFKEKFTDADLLKQLNEASSLKDLIAIREKFKEPDGGVVKVSGGKAGPGEVVGKEGATKDAAKAPGVSQTLKTTPVKDEEQVGVDSEGKKLGGSLKGNAGSRGVAEDVSSEAGPGEVEGKEKPTKDAAKDPGKSETLADKKDDKDEEGKKGADDTGKKESVSPGARTTTLVEAVLMSPDREFNVSELSGSIRRLSESRK
jgi:hypothetical protein